MKIPSQCYCITIIVFDIKIGNLKFFTFLIISNNNTDRCKQTIKLCTNSLHTQNDYRYTLTKMNNINIDSIARSISMRKSRLIGWNRNNMCRSGAICLLTDRLLFQCASTKSMLVQYKEDITIISSNVTCPCHDRADILLILALNNNDSLTLLLTYFVLFVFSNRQNLELRDGGSVRSPLLNTGTPIVKSLSFLTRYNLLWIHYRMNKTGSDVTADEFSFNLEYKTYSEFIAHSLFIVFYIMSLNFISTSFFHFEGQLWL